MEENKEKIRHVIQFYYDIGQNSTKTAKQTICIAVEGQSSSKSWKLERKSFTISCEQLDRFEAGDRPEANRIGQ